MITKHISTTVTWIEKVTPKKKKKSVFFLCLFSVKPECLLSHCIVAPMLALDPALPANITLKELPTLSQAFSAAKELLTLSKPFQPSAAASVLVFHLQAEGKPDATTSQTCVSFHNPGWASTLGLRV